MIESSTICEDCGVPTPEPPVNRAALCDLCAAERLRRYKRKQARAQRVADHALPKLGELNPVGKMAVATWPEIAFVLGMDKSEAQRCLRMALQRIKDSGCDVAMLFDQLHSHRLFHPPPTVSPMVDARQAIEAWQMEADIIAPEAPAEAEAIRREVEALKKAIK